MLVEYLIEKALDKAYELIRLGYRKLDVDQTFLIAFENALSAYKSNFGEDELYNQFFKEHSVYYSGIIKNIIDSSPSARELESNLVDKIIELLPNHSIEKIESFVTQICTELFFTDEYRNKILEYRRDNEIGKIYKDLLELKQTIEGVQSVNVEFENNMFQYYLNKWNDSLFLHKNAKNKIYLKDIYVLPYYKDKNSSNSDGIRKDLDEKIDLFLGESVIGNRRKPMIILADAGMGKSSLVAYICSKCPQENNVIVLKFADLHKDSFETNILSSVLNELKCKIEDLRNKRLIIDGFDESEFTSDKNRLLSDFFNKCQSIRGLKVLVTSRVNYVDGMKFTNCKLYYLQFMNEEQKIEMSTLYFNKSGETPIFVNRLLNNEVIGVPLILYMILSLKIYVEDDIGICELYEKIFAFDGGIYDRMTMENSDGYTEEVHPIAYYNVKKQVHLISQLIAFSMFETTSLLLSSDKYLSIVKNVSEERIKDFAISNYYYIESSTYTLSFCHKSIYEYFVAEYIFGIITKCNEIEMIAKKLACLLKKDLLTGEILEFLRYKVKKNYKDNKTIYSHIELAVNLMICNGMTYFLEEKLVDILKIERTIFLNILLILDSFYIGTNCNQYKNIEISSQFLSQVNNRYTSIINLKNISLSNIKLNKKGFLNNLDLSNSMLSNVNFEDSNLSLSYFERTNLYNVTFNQAVLSGTIFSNSIILYTVMNYARLGECKFISCVLKNFEGQKAMFENSSFENAQIIEATFKKSDLSYANFKNSILKDVNFSDAILNNVDFCGADLTGINLHLARQTNSIKIDRRTVLTNATIDSSFVHQLQKCDLKNLVGLKIFDIQKNEEITLAQYEKRYNNDI